MPAIEVYSVNFAGDNLTPSLDSKGWGDICPGRSRSSAVTAGHYTGEVDIRPDNVGINISAYRARNSQHAVSVGRYVVFPPGGLPLATRLIMRVEFDHPDTRQVPGLPHNTFLPVEPWAVALKIKFGGADDLPGEPNAAVTCQFHETQITVPGVRLNTPGSQQRDQADNLDSPLDYTRYKNGPYTPFTLEFAFCGVQAGPTATPSQIGHASGCGALSIGPKKDQRVFSTTALSGGAQPWIGALGVALTTSRAEGTIMVRLRSFSVALIAPGTPP